MLKGILGGLGINPEIVGRVTGAIGNELQAAAGEQLAAVAEQKFTEFFQPLVGGIREAVYATIAGDMPPGFAARLRAKGYSDANDAQLQQLWVDVVASVSEQPRAAEEEAAGATADPPPEMASA